nr:hypothetical protein [Tanacetum cinerariifolium]
LIIQEDELAEVQEVVDVVTTAKLITEVVTAASMTISDAEPKVLAATITAAPMQEEENRAIQSINETSAQKSAKRRKLNKEVEDFKRYLEIVPDEDDDVYTEATPLARKTNNFSDDFFLTTLGAMFERPDGQSQVWKNQRAVHGQAKVKSWKLLESCGVHIITFTTTQLILLVERRYPLSRFTLDQMLNVVRLRVEEQSEMSLELLRFTRQ